MERSFKKLAHREFLAVQWLAHPAFTAEGSDRSLVRGIKIVQMVGCGKKKKNGEKLAHVTMGAGKSQFCTEGPQAGTPRRADAARVQMPSAGRIPFPSVFPQCLQLTG